MSLRDFFPRFPLDIYALCEMWWDYDHPPLQKKTYYISSID